ncbi:MAG: hypothetical protein ABJJ25_00860 [Eudoraea sp.]|uniref:hypothetical protein n=1 Tax=Eudoraea sp. TaxID=1979955 RepID=UPI003267B159
MRLKDELADSYLQQLKRVCESMEFRSKPRMKKFLTYVTNEYVEGRADNIKGYSIAVDVFNQQEDFDPDLNALVRINAGRLRRLLRLYYLEEGVDDPIRIEIPKGKYVPKFKAKSNTQESKKPGGDVKAKETVGVLKPRIAVLPFRNLSKKEELEFLCFGIAQELASAAAKYDDLRVKGSLQRPPQESLDKAAFEYFKSEGINYLTDGDIAVFDNKVNIGVRLIDVNENLRMWGEHFKVDLETDNLFDVQTKIAELVASKVGTEYGLINKKKSLFHNAEKTDSPSEYMVLLKYYYHETQLTEKSGQDLFESVEKALVQNPNSGLLLAIKADLFGDMYALDFPDSKEAYKIFGELAEKAFAINPHNPFVRAILAYKCFMYEEEERFYKICDETVPWIPNTPIRLGSFAIYLSLFGEWVKGKELMDRILENNIDIPMWLYGITCLYFYKGEEYELALREANKYQMPMFYWGPLLRAAVHGQLKQKEAALKNIEDLLIIRPDFKQRGRYLITRFIKEDSLVLHVIEGLSKGGLKIKA